MKNTTYITEPQIPFQVNDKFSIKAFGALPDGRTVNIYTICNTTGVQMSVMNYGAIITSLQLHGKCGKRDIVLGFDTLDEYIMSGSIPHAPYFGAVIGRYSGRIKDGSFRIDDKDYTLTPNNGPNTLHGGRVGFDKVYWEVKNIEYTPDVSITFAYTSNSGEENFPGKLNIEVRYTLTAGNEIFIDYKAVASDDTIINMTQHTYFNMDGHQSNVLDQELSVNADTILEIDEANIPTGRFMKAADKGFDFVNGGYCPAKIDDSFIINDTKVAAAILKSPKSGLQLTVFSDQPSLHIYVGGFCVGMKGKEGVSYHHHSGICFESQNYPDAPNHSHFPNAILRRGETYTQKTIWKFDYYNCK